MEYDSDSYGEEELEDLETTERNHIVVVAIDFGTTYSGYAFSFRKDFEKNEEGHLAEINTKHWHSGDLLSDKTPTTLLLDEDKNFVNFGYGAETEYGRMTEEERKEHYYFRRFKMMLYDKDGNLRLTRDTVLKDMRDKELPAMDVFRHSIRYLKDLFIEDFTKRNTSIKILPLDNSVTWVITVPAIWDEPAKQFMKEAAEGAGIPESSLLICLEPEAAAIYCKSIPVERDNELFSVMKPGRRFLVLDAGGGTIDMAMQEVRENGELQEISRAEGGDWGGIYVDAEFKQMLEDIVSKPIVEAFRMKHTGDYIELFRNFERKKRENPRGKNVRIYIPSTLLEIVADIDKLTEEKGLQEKVKWIRDKAHINIQKYAEFFNNVIDKIVVKVEEMLVADTKGTNVIIMVGGFSASEFLQKRIKDSFPSCKVVIPPECGLAVLKGAVLYGHDPDIMAAKKMRYTFGVGTNTEFITGTHPEAKKRIINGKEYCTDKFDIYARINQLKHRNKVTKGTYFPLYEDQTSAKFRVFISDKRNPQYTDEEGCRERGSFVVPMPDTRGGTNRKIMVKFRFGKSFITVTGIDETSNQSVNVKLDFLAYL